jgi:hypothetical protein
MASCLDEMQIQALIRDESKDEQLEGYTITLRTVGRLNSSPFSG